MQPTWYCSSGHSWEGKDNSQPNNCPTCGGDGKPLQAYSPTLDGSNLEPSQTPSDPTLQLDSQPSDSQFKTISNNNELSVKDSSEITQPTLGVDSLVQRDATLSVEEKEAKGKSVSRESAITLDLPSLPQQSAAQSTPTLSDMDLREKNASLLKPTEPEATQEPEEKSVGQDPFDPTVSFLEQPNSPNQMSEETVAKETNPFLGLTPSTQPLDATATGGRELPASNFETPTLDYPLGQNTNPIAGKTTEAVSGSNPMLEQTAYKDLSDVPSSPTFQIQQQAKNKGKEIPSPPGYEILGELGRGAMGVVYKARQMGLKRLVALKMILTSTRTTPAKLARFQAEAEAVAKLDHPSIVRIYEIGTIGELPFFSLEYVTGGTLGDRVKKTPPTVRQAAMVMRALAEAMDLSHRKGIVHRDLKPANILLAPPDQGGEVTDLSLLPIDAFIPKVTDFGLVKTLESDSIETKEGSIMGTPSYMAPEQAQGKTNLIGPPADIYGLGAILYDLITGIPPFRGETIMDTLSQVINREPVPPSRLNTGLPKDLGTICLKCLEKDASRRYATAADLAEDLRRYLAGEPIMARPTPWHEQLWKWAKRKPAAAALALTLSLGVMALTVGGYVLARHEKKRADENFRLKQDAVKERNTAQEQRAFAEKNFREALETVNQLLTRVGTDRLAYEPRMEKVRHALLLDAKASLLRFLKDRNEDPQAQRQTGVTLRHLGAIEELIGQPKEAEKNLNESIQILAQLHPKDPTNTDLATDLADSHQILAQVLFKQNKGAESGKHFQAAKDLYTKTPPNAQRDSLLAAASFNLAQIQISQGMIKEAKSIQEEARALLEKSQTLPDANESIRRRFGQSYLGLAQTYEQLRLVAEGRAALNSALAIFQKLAVGNKENPDYRQDLAKTWIQIGLLLRDIEPVEAAKAYEKSIAECEKLIQGFPATPSYRQDLAQALNNLGVLREATGKPLEAGQAYEKSFQISKELSQKVPWVPDYRKDYAFSMVGRGLNLQLQNRLKDAAPYFQQALIDLRELVNKYPESIDYQSFLATTLYNEGILQNNLGNAPEAELTIVEAEKELRKLLKRAGAVPEFRKVLGQTLNAKAELALKRLEFNTAKSLFEEAVTILSSLHSEFPKEPDYLDIKCKSLIELGKLVFQSKKTDLAQKMWLEAQKDLGKLAKIQHQVPMIQHDIATRISQLGLFLYQSGKRDEGEKAWEEAADLERVLVEKFPKVDNYKVGYAMVLSNQALAFWEKKDNQKAIDLFLASLEILRQGDLAGSFVLTETQWNTLEKLAEILTLSGKFPEAEKYYRERIAAGRKLIQMRPMDEKYFDKFSQHLFQFAIFLAARNRPAEGIPFLEESRKVAMDSPIKFPESYFSSLLLQSSNLLFLASNFDASLKELQELMKDKMISGQLSLQAAGLASEVAIFVEGSATLAENEKRRLGEAFSLSGLDFLGKALKAGTITRADVEKNKLFAPLRKHPNFAKTVEPFKK